MIVDRCLTGTISAIREFRRHPDGADFPSPEQICHASELGQLKLLTSRMSFR
jgi:hypothetical protein